MTRLAEILKKKRKELDLDAEDIARQIGKSKRTYLYYEEDVTPPLDVLKKLSLILQFDVNEIYSSATILHNEKAPNAIKEVKKSNEMKSDYTQELINALKENVEVLKKNNNNQEEIIKGLSKANSDLKAVVQADLKTVLDNQLTLTALFESYLKSFASLMIDEPANQQEFRVILHKEAFERKRALNKTGSHLRMDSEDIVSSDT